MVLGVNEVVGLQHHLFVQLMMARPSLGAWRYLLSGGGDWRAHWCLH